jgi:hypothetical protein
VPNHPVQVCPRECSLLQSTTFPKTLKGTLEAPPLALPCWLIRYFFFAVFFAGAFFFTGAFLVAICLFSLSDGLH